MVVATPSQTIDASAKELFERLSTAAGDEAVQFIKVEEPFAYRMCADADTGPIFGRLLRILEQDSQMSRILYDVEAEEIIGSPAYEMFEALCTRYTKRGKRRLSGDPAIDAGITIAHTAHRAFCDELNRHKEALTQIAKETRRNFRNLTKVPLPSECDDQPALRHAANRAGLAPHVKSAPSRKTKTAVRKKKSVPPKR
jgi:hypothetical protein